MDNVWCVCVQLMGSVIMFRLKTLNCPLTDYDYFQAPFALVDRSSDPLL